MTQEEIFKILTENAQYFDNIIFFQWLSAPSNGSL